jgi:hypothetical protein
MTNKERIQAELDKYEHEVSALMSMKGGIDAYIDMKIHLAEQKVKECKKVLEELNKGEN